MATGQTLTLDFRPTVSDFILATATGKAREIAAFGTRGDGKTWGAFGAMITHARYHHEAGYPLPTKWLGAADTFTSHKAKTHESLTAPGWRGTWRLKDDGHVAEFAVAGTTLVQLRLFGVEDQSGMDRLRAECHGLWFEEPAPSSVLVQSSGLSESAWALGLTSQRLPSHCHPAIMTLNYPDEDHWTWQRFVVNQHPGTMYFRIPPGELASAEQRAEWARALEGRPDMLRRLLQGQPGTLLLGAQVAVGFNADTHVAAMRLAPARGIPLWLGQDGGHTPTTVIGQRLNGRLHILASLSSEYAGMRQHVKDLVLPWLGEHAPWALEGSHELLQIRYDPSIDVDDAGDIEINPLRVMKSLLRGSYRPGPVTWAGRLNPLLATLNAMHLGAPVLQVDRSCAGLIRALNGGWYYATGPDGKVTKADRANDLALPKKPNHPHEDYGDALCYLVAGMAPTREPIKPPVIDRVKAHAFNPVSYMHERRR